MIRSFILFAPTDKNEEDKDEPYVFKLNNSIFNGTEPEIIAQNFADALNQSPIKSKQRDNCCGGAKRWNFELQNDNHFSIETRKLTNNFSILLEMGLAQSDYHNKNLSLNAAEAKNIVLNFTTSFLKSFSVALGDDYSISVSSWHGNRSWRVNIYQIFNGKFINGTGVHATVSRETGEIRTMEINDWLDPKNSIEEQISIDDGKVIIYNELEDDHFNITVISEDEYYDEKNDTHVSFSFEKNHTIPINISIIEFIEYRALWGRLCYRYEINFQINETKTCVYRYDIDVESGKILYWSCSSGSSGLWGMIKLFYNNLI